MWPYNESERTYRWERVLLVAGVPFMIFYALGYVVNAAYESREFIDNCIVQAVESEQPVYTYAVKDYCDALWRLRE